ncbi:MAG: hypothetical protein H0U08_00785 [Actinobacteria bacterium]|nr:hypothetical protein [Actinomycetota bacterium]
MVRALLVVLAVGLLALGGAAGWFAARETEEAVTTTETDTATVTETTTEATPSTGLPAAVEETRAALLVAAESGDYGALRPLIPSTGFEYTFGGPVEGGPIAHWQEIERSTVERPIENLAAVLQMPYTLSRGIYFWPFAYDITGVDELTAHERELLEPLGPLDTLFVPGTGYLGWRAGIEPDGDWVFFVAGD